MLKEFKMNLSEGVWLSINDYSRYKNVSISTIRRHIKNNILKHKEENGKYFIYVSSNEKILLREEEEGLRQKLEIELQRQIINQLREENYELKMLVDLYERSNFKGVINDTPPEIPINI